MKKKLAMILSTALVVSALTACGNSNDASKTPSGSTQESSKEGTAESSKATGTDGGASATGEGKQLAVQLGPDPETIDPALNSTADGGNIILHTFERLLAIDQDGSIIPGQAEKWEVSDDGLTWTFHLREGLKWSDGSDLTAEDFVYSWKRVCDPTVAAPYAETVLNMVEGFETATKAAADGGDINALGVSAPDASTFVVKLSSPCPYFESIAAFATLSPVQKATVEANGDAWAISPETFVTNGAFYIGEWVPGSHITMIKNPNYWNASAIKLGSLKFVLMDDANAAYSAYQAGELSLIKEVPTEEIPSLVGNPEYRVEPMMGTYYLSMNLNDPAFENKDFRKALNLAIDREYVANTLMQGTYAPASNLVGPGWIDTDGATPFQDNSNGGKPYIDTTNHEANIEEAKKLLDSAGYPEGKGSPVLTYTTNPEGYNKAVAEYLQQAWAEIGVTMNVDIVEWKSFSPMRRNGDFVIARNGWSGDYSDPSNILELFYSTNGNNDGKFNNPDFDKAIEAARTALDPVERSAALHEAEDIIMEEAGCFPLAYYNEFYLQKENVTGAWHSPYGYWYLMYADVQ